MLFYKPQPIIETTAPGMFEPAHPAPRTEPLGVIPTIIGGRRSIIGDWMDSHYEPGIDSFRILTRQVVVVNEPSAIKYVLHTQNQRYERKSPLMRRALEALFRDGLFITDGETWRKRRPVIANVIHKNRLKEFSPVMEQVLAETVETLEALSPGTTVEWMPFMAELAAQIISRTAFGTELGAEAKKDVVDGFNRYQRIVDNYNLPYFLGIDEGWPVRKSRRLKQAIASVHGPIESIVSQHLAGHGDERSMVSSLVRIQRENPQLGLDATAIRNEAAMFFMTGHESTAVTLAWAWYCLARAPWAEAALHEEIDGVLAGRPPSLADVPKLDYCRAVVEESLRLYPAVPILPRQAGEEDEINGVKIEKAALVLITPWLTQRTAAFWENPHHFKPERFLDSKRPLPYTYLPFAAGPRICAGLSFAMTEAILAIATLAQRFTFKTADDYIVEPLCRLTLRPHDGMPLKVYPR